MGRQGPLEPWKPSWACLGAVSGLSWDPGPWESFRRPSTAANRLQTGRTTGALAPSSRAPFGPLEGLRAPQHQGKPGANSSNNGPPYWLPPGTLLGRLKAFLGRLAALLGRHIGRRGSLETVLDVLWETTGAHFWPSRRALGPSWASLWAVLGLSWVPGKTSGALHRDKPAAN